MRIRGTFWEHIQQSSSMSVAKQDVRNLCIYLKECWSTTTKVTEPQKIKTFQKKQNLGCPIYNNNKSVSKNNKNLVIGWEFPAKLTSYHRREVHTIAEELKIVHCSSGDSRMRTRHIALYCSHEIMEELTGCQNQGSSSKSANIEGEKGNGGNRKKRGQKDDSVQRAVQKALQKAAAAKQEEEKLRKEQQEKMSEKETLQRLEEDKKKILDVLRTTLKNMRGLRGTEASASRAMYINMIQELTGTDGDMSADMKEKNTSVNNSKKVNTHESNSDTSESESESDSDSDDDDLSLITRKKRPVVSGFAFSDSESSSSDDDEVEEEDVKEKEVVTVQVRKKKKRGKPAPKSDTFDEISFLANATKAAKEEAARHQQSLKKNITNKQKVLQDNFVLPPKRSERNSNGGDKNTKINVGRKAPEVKVSEEDARRLAIMAAVAAARLEKQLKEDAEEVKNVRKATINDILGVTSTEKNGGGMADGGAVDVMSFRKQVEYGPKKFIKP
jgi:hypothetical protein